MQGRAQEGRRDLPRVHAVRRSGDSRRRRCTVRRAATARSPESRRRDSSRAGWYSRSASPPVTVSSTSSVLPAARARATSAARISAAPTPGRRPRRCTSILATSARCGWFSGWLEYQLHRADDAAVVSLATNSSRSPRARRRATPRQKARARLARQRQHEAHRGAALDAVDEHVRQRARYRAERRKAASHASPDTRCDHHDVTRCLARAIAERGGTVEHEGEAVAASRSSCVAADRQLRSVPSSTQTC